MNRDLNEEIGVSRRAVVQIGITAAAATLAGCSTYGARAKAKATPRADGATGTTAAFANAADIPLGSGKIFESEGVVVTQPTAGTFVAFSSTCTHAGCPLASVSGGTMNCDCHGSKFHIADGSVAKGPATEALAPAKIVVAGGRIALG